MESNKKTNTPNPAPVVVSPNPNPSAYSYSWPVPSRNVAKDPQKTASNKPVESLRTTKNG